MKCSEIRDDGTTEEESDATLYFIGFDWNNVKPGLSRTVFAVMPHPSPNVETGGKTSFSLMTTERLTLENRGSRK